MGVLARDNLYNQGGGLGGGSANNSYYSGSNSPVNSSSYSGIASSSKATNTYTSSTQAVASVPSASGSPIGRVVTSNGQTSTQSIPISLVYEASQKVPSASGGSGDNTGYKYYTEAEKKLLPDGFKEVVNQSEQFQKYAQKMQEDGSNLKNDMKQSEVPPYTQGKPLPEVLVDNSKAFQKSFDNFTTVFYDQFSLLNNNMMGVLLYFEQFLANQTRGVNSLSEIPKGLQKMNIPEIKVPEIKIPEIKIPEIKVSSPNISVNVPEIKVPETKIDFSTLSTSLDKLVQNDTFKKFIEVQQKSSENSKEFFDKKGKEADLNMESLEYDKKPQEVKDLDGQTVGTFAPREASLVKNAAVAKETTDKNNFDIDDLIDDDPLDLTSILGYEKSSDIILDYVQKMQGKI